MSNGMRYYTLSYRVNGKLVQSSIYGFERAMYQAKLFSVRGIRCLVDVTPMPGATP